MNTGVQEHIHGKTLWRLAALLIVASLALPWGVLADNLIADGDYATPVDTDPLALGNICAGATKSGNVLFAINRVGGGQTFANGATVTVSVDQTPTNATVAMTDSQIALPDNWVALGNNTLSTDTAASQVTVDTVGLALGLFDQTVKYNASGAKNGGGTVDRPGNLNVTWTVVACEITDTTPPVITPNVSGTPGNNGWYVSDVTVSWTVVDDESDVTSTTGCDETTINADTAGTTLTCSATSAGGTATESVTIKRDATAPTLTWSNGPQDHAVYYWGFVPAEPTCTAADGLSGPDGCTVSGYSAAIGRHTMTATAYDVAGNSAAESRTYEVKAWTLTGFYQPVDMGGVWNTIKGGSTVPLKFNVYAGETELTDVAVVDSFTVKGVACPSASAATDDIEFVTTGGTSLRYDAVGMQFVQNWQTPKKPGACYVVTMTTDDGSSLSANFKLK